MTDYNHRLCDILKEINNYIQQKNLIEVGETQKETEDVKPHHINNAISNLEQCNSNDPKLNIIVNFIKQLMSNPETADTVVKMGNKGLNIAKSQTSSTSLNDIYNKLINLDSEIQDETLRIYNKYSINTDSIITEQNKQYENFKFNKLYLFLFNLGIIFIILRSSYFKKTY